MVQKLCGSTGQWFCNELLLVSGLQPVVRVLHIRWHVTIIRATITIILLKIVDFIHIVVVADIVIIANWGWTMVIILWVGMMVVVMLLRLVIIYMESRAVQLRLLHEIVL